MRVESKANLSPRKVGLLATAGILGALLAGCAESSRFSDPFGNPFESSARSSDRTPTASTRQSYNAPQNYSAPLGRVQSRPLSAPGASASYSAPAYQNPQMASAPTSAPTSTGSIIRSTGPGGWTAQGGPQVTVGQGDTANVLANRYGVPTDALLRVNGYSNAAQITPGSRLTIPVYTSSAAAAAAGAAATSAPATAAKTVDKAQDKAKAATDSAKMKFVKGPDAAKPDAKAKAKPADDDEEDEKPVASKRDKTSAKPVEKPKTAAKPAKDEDDEDEKPAAKSSKAKPTAAKEQPTKKTAAKPAQDDDEEDEKPAVKPTAKPTAKPKQAAVEKPAEVAKPQAKVAKVEPESKKIDQTPTASLPPAETKTAAAGEAANPEFRWPARGRIIQGFKAGGNDGINIAVPEGTSVKAAEGGVVAYAGSELKGYGNLVLIRHPNGFVSAYAHNGDIEVKRGEQVKRGQTIAKSGQSGNVASPQLHFELRKGSTPVDPTGYLAGL